MLQFITTSLKWMHSIKIKIFNPHYHLIMLVAPRHIIILAPQVYQEVTNKIILESSLLHGYKLNNNKLTR